MLDVFRRNHIPSLKCKDSSRRSTSIFLLRPREGSRDFCWDVWRLPLGISGGFLEAPGAPENGALVYRLASLGQNPGCRLRAVGSFVKNVVTCNLEWRARHLQPTLSFTRGARFCLFLDLQN